MQNKALDWLLGGILELKVDANSDQNYKAVRLSEKKTVEIVKRLISATMTG